MWARYAAFLIESMNEARRHLQPEVVEFSGPPVMNGDDVLPARRKPLPGHWGYADATQTQPREVFASTAVEFEQKNWGPKKFKPDDLVLVAMPGQLPWPKHEDTKSSLLDDAIARIRRRTAASRTVTEQELFALPHPDDSNEMGGLSHSGTWTLESQPKLLGKREKKRVRKLGKILA